MTCSTRSRTPTSTARPPTSTSACPRSRAWSAARRCWAPTDIPSGIKKIDDHTVEITLKAPDSTFLRKLAGAVYYIMPEHVLGAMTPLEAETCDFCLGVAGTVVGSGPYDLTTSISATGAGFTAKENYWKGNDGPVKEIDYRIQESNVSVAQLAAGELDLTIRVPPAEGPGLADVPGLKQLNVPGVGIFALNFNHNNTDKAFRQAVAYSINRQEIIDSVLGGLATHQLHHPARVQHRAGAAGQDQPLRLRPRGKAKAALAESAGATRPFAWRSSRRTRTSPSRPRRCSRRSRMPWASPSS